MRGARLPFCASESSHAYAKELAGWGLFDRTDGQGSRGNLYLRKRSAAHYLNANASLLAMSTPQAPP